MACPTPASYAGLMIGSAGHPDAGVQLPHGRPETQPILDAAQVDMLSRGAAGCHRRRIRPRSELQWDRRTALGVVLAAGLSAGPRKGGAITGLPRTRTTSWSFTPARWKGQRGAHRFGSQGAANASPLAGARSEQAQQRAYDAIRGIHFEACSSGMTSAIGQSSHERRRGHERGPARAWRVREWLTIELSASPVPSTPSTARRSPRCLAQRRPMSPTGRRHRAASWKAGRCSTCGLWISRMCEAETAALGRSIGRSWPDAPFELGVSLNFCATLYCPRCTHECAHAQRRHPGQPAVGCSSATAWTSRPITGSPRTRLLPHRAACARALRDRQIPALQALVRQYFFLKHRSLSRAASAASSSTRDFAGAARMALRCCARWAGSRRPTCPSSDAGAPAALGRARARVPALPAVANIVQPGVGPRRMFRPAVWRPPRSILLSMPPLVTGPTSGRTRARGGARTATSSPRGTDSGCRQGGGAAAVGVFGAFDPPHIAHVASPARPSNNCGSTAASCPPAGLAQGAALGDAAHRRCKRSARFRAAGAGRHRRVRTAAQHLSYTVDTLLRWRLIPAGCLVPGRSGGDQAYPPGFPLAKSCFDSLQWRSVARPSTLASDGFLGISALRRFGAHQQLRACR